MYFPYLINFIEASSRQSRYDRFDLAEMGRSSAAPLLGNRHLRRKIVLVI
jgi:hypothetical protein